MKSTAREAVSQMPVGRWTQQTAATCILPKDTEDQPMRVLSCQATVGAVKAQALDREIECTGSVLYTVFYTSAGALYSAQREEPFSCRFRADGVEASMRVACEASAGHVRIRNLDAGAVSAECPLELTVSVSQEVTRAAIEEITEPPVETARVSCRWCRGEIQAQGQVTIQEDVLLDASLPQLDRILSAGGRLEAQESRVDAGQLVCRGILHAWVLYVPSGGALPVIARFTVPGEGSIPCPGMEEGSSPYWQAEPARITARVYADLQGEMRVLSVMATCEVKGYEPIEDAAVFLEDAFALQGALEVDTERWLLPDVTKRSQRTLDVRTSFPLEGDPPRQVAAAFARAYVDTLQVTYAKVTLTGTLECELLCLDVQDQWRMVAGSAPLEFSWKEDMGQGGLYAALTDPQIQAVCVDGKWQLSGRVIAQITCNPVKELTVAVGARETELPEELQWGLTLLIAGREDTLWSLARQCRVPVETITRCNPQLAGRSVEPGEALVILR